MLWFDFHVVLLRSPFVWLPDALEGRLDLPSYREPCQRYCATSGPPASLQNVDVQLSEDTVWCNAYACICMINVVLWCTMHASTVMYYHVLSCTVCFLYGVFYVLWCALYVFCTCFVCVCFVCVVCALYVFSCSFNLDRSRMFTDTTRITVLGQVILHGVCLPGFLLGRWVLCTLPGEAHHDATQALHLALNEGEIGLKNMLIKEGQSGSNWYISHSTNNRISCESFVNMEACPQW